MSGGAQEEHNTKRPGRGEREGGGKGGQNREKGREGGRAAGLASAALGLGVKRHCLTRREGSGGGRGNGREEAKFLFREGIHNMGALDEVTFPPHELILLAADSKTCLVSRPNYMIKLG